MKILRNARKAEQVIRSAVLPRSVMAKVAGAHPALGPAQLAAVEHGLREWLICCAHREGAQLGMPSRAVDWAWHELILHTPAYHALCRAAYGEYLHHVPEPDMPVRLSLALHETVRAWDRSERGRAGHEPTLWQLDERLGLEDALGVSAQDLRASRMANLTPQPRRWRTTPDDGRHAVWLTMDGFHGGHGGHGGDGGGGCGGGG
jgi:hypothetical protein